MVCYNLVQLEEVVDLCQTLWFHAVLPDLSKDRSRSESDEHRLPIRTSNHLHLPGLYDVHLPAHLALNDKDEIRKVRIR